MSDKLDQYINDKYDNASDWFIEEVQSISNQQRVLDVMDKKKYLNGSHKIKQTPSYKYNGKEFNPRRIVLQYAKTLLSFQQNYLLGNPITFTGNEDIVKEFLRVNKQGKYNRLNQKILDKVLKYGSVAEYVYLDGKVIKSKLIDPSEGFPVYDNENNLIAFIEAYVSDGISYYNVFTDKYVEKYNNEGDTLKLIDRKVSLSGMPIVYHNDNELSDVEGRSELDDWIEILDSMEDLISKYTDSFYKFIDPIFITKGQTLKGESIPSEIVGKGINMDDGADAEFLSNKLDYKSFETIYKTLLQSLLDTSSTPAVSMNKTDISNLSEVSLKLLFSLADEKAGLNEQFMREGIEQRNEKIRKLLALQGVTFDEESFDTLDFVFHYNQPSNDKETIENLEKLNGMGAISLETILAKNPYVNDVATELKRLSNVDNKKGNNEGNNHNDKQVS
ncbi:phage portal protein [Heyndrickxia shackletonii]|uniref:Phage portal protein n=2 Tax=Heyndrickxia shackletonii TaxID=157838 RepID=A0A0Q3TJC9_9BACI|nr:phage portal protein [Heyndrickxia shackletonii]KQL54056.1 phage portal protein [Heyndrickxia shackletonii]